MLIWRGVEGQQGAAALRARQKGIEDEAVVRRCSYLDAEEAYDEVLSKEGSILKEGAGAINPGAP